MRIFVLKKDTLIRIAAFAIIIVGAVFYTRAVATADEEAFSEAGGAEITRIATNNKDIAITIDTVFGSDNTAEILDVLEKHGSNASFAVMGAWAQENPMLVNEILDAGNEIFSHSMTHERYEDIGIDAALKDAIAAKEYLKTEYGVDTDMIRFPYGAGGDEMLAAFKDAGFTPVKWSIDSKDWRGDDAEKIADRVIAEIKPGSVIMFQNGGTAAAEALDIILEALADRAYSTVPLSELIDNASLGSNETD